MRRIFATFAVLAGTILALNFAVPLLREDNTVAVVAGVVLLFLLVVGLWYYAKWLVLPLRAAGKSFRNTTTWPSFFFAMLASHAQPSPVHAASSSTCTHDRACRRTLSTGRVCYNFWSEDVLSYPCFIHLISDSLANAKGNVS